MVTKYEGISFRYWRKLGMMALSCGEHPPTTNCAR